jgi:hypothetical protein
MRCGTRPRSHRPCLLHWGPTTWRPRPRVNLSLANPEYANEDVVNEVLAQSVMRDRRLMVLDWASYAADNQIVNTPDGVHYDTPGYQERAKFYTCAVQDTPECIPYQIHQS